MRFINAGIALLASIFFMFGQVAYGQKTPEHYYVKVQTPKGDCLVMLYDETPQHRDNFIKLVKEGFYEDLMFHRVIENFMVQGGDPDSRYAAETQRLGSGGPDYRVPAEIRDSIIHRKGALAAARTDNPEKASSASQFYLVQGHVFSEAALDSLEQSRLKGEKLSPLQREVYTTLGGVPHLDGNYTVFGEVIQGLDVIDSIAAVRTDNFDRPIEDVRMNMHLLTRREAINLERERKGLPVKENIFTKIMDALRSRYY